MPNHIVRWQIVTPEPAQAAAFYREVFGWELSVANSMGYIENCALAPKAPRRLTAAFGRRLRDSRALSNFS